MYTQAHGELAAIRPVMVFGVRCCVPMLSTAIAIAVTVIYGEWGAIKAIAMSPAMLAVIAAIVGVVGGVDVDEAVRHRNRFVFLAASASTHGVGFSLALLALIAVVGEELPHMHDALLFFMAFTLAMVGLTLGLVRLSITHALRAPPGRAVVVAINEASIEFVRSLTRDPFVSVDFLGFFEDRSPDRVPEAGELHVLGRIDDIARYLAANPVEQVFISLPMEAAQRIGTVMEHLLDSAASVHYLHDFVAFKPIHESLSWVAGVPIYTVIGRPDAGIPGILKRIFDMVGAALALLVLAPLLLLVALLVKLESPGPVLFSQRRYGSDGRPFRIYKFRSMTLAACAARDVAQATRCDARVTRVGRFIRRTSIDELPQLINILRGDMSLVGPRPHAVPHNEHYRHLIRGYMLRHKVRPGLTGWAQVHGLRGETETLDKMENRVRFDLEYLREWSVSLDVYIVLLTVRQLFRGV